MQEGDTPTNAQPEPGDRPVTKPSVAALPPRILPMLLASIVAPRSRVLLESVHPQTLFLSEWKRWYERLNNAVGGPTVASFAVPKELLEFQLTNQPLTTAATTTTTTTGATIPTRDGCTENVSITASSPALVQIAKWCLSSVSVTAAAAAQDGENLTTSKMNLSDSANDNHGELLSDHSKDPLLVAQIAAAMVLLGWFIPGQDVTATAETTETAIDETDVPCECPFCLGQFDWNYALHQPTPAVASPLQKQPGREDGDVPQPPSKRARRTNSSGSLATEASSSSRTTMMTAHKYYCPYIVGFPIQGASSATPLWQSLSRRVLVSGTSPALALQKRVANKTTHATFSSVATATTTTLEPASGSTPLGRRSDLALNEQTVGNDDTEKDDREYDSTAASFLQMHQILRSSLSPRFRRPSAKSRPTLSPLGSPPKQPETV